MRKKVGIIKRLFTLLLVFLLSINSFAAIVSDNDGSAFITKAEFDALKSSFQSQIDTYNQSIDSKIDGAIASYLSGMKISDQYSDKIIFSDWNKYKLINSNTDYMINNEYKMPNFEELIIILNASGSGAGWFNMQQVYINISKQQQNKMKKCNVKMIKNDGGVYKACNESDYLSATLPIRVVWDGVYNDWIENWYGFYYGKTSQDMSWANQNTPYLYNPYELNIPDGVYNDNIASTPGTSVWNPKFVYIGNVWNATNHLNTLYCNVVSSNKEDDHIGSWTSSNKIELYNIEYKHIFKNSANQIVNAKYIKDNATVKKWGNAWKGNDADGGHELGKTNNDWNITVYNYKPGTSTDVTTKLASPCLVGNFNSNQIFINDSIISGVFMKENKSMTDLVSLINGFPIYYAKKGTKCSWTANFNEVNIGGVAQPSEEVNVVLALAPFGDELDCSSGYIASPTGSVWTTSGRNVTMSWTQPDDGFIYAKWYPSSLSGSNITTTKWSVTLDVNSSNEFIYISTD